MSSFHREFMINIDQPEIPCLTLLPPGHPWATLACFQRRSQQRAAHSPAVRSCPGKQPPCDFSAHFNQKKCGFLCKKSCFVVQKEKIIWLILEKKTVFYWLIWLKQIVKNGIWLDLPDKIGDTLDFTWRNLINAVTIKIGDSSAAFDEKIGYISGFKPTNNGDVSRTWVKLGFGQ